MTNHSHQPKEITKMGYTAPIRPGEAMPPNNTEAEQQLLGAILVSNDAFHRVSDILSEEHFFDPVHQRIYAAMARRIRNSHLVDAVILKIEFEGDEGLQQLGGPRYLVRLAGAAISIRSVRDYALQVIDAYQRRVLLDAMREAARSISLGLPVAEAQAAVELAGSKIIASDAKPPTISMLAASTKAMEMAHRSFMGEAAGLTTGIRSFDDLTGGFFPEDLVIIPGAPSMGKTALALALAESYAKGTKGVCFVSLEMGDYSLAQRLMSSISGVPYRNIRRGAYSAEQGADLMRAFDQVSHWPVEIVHGHVRDVTGIYAAARRVQRAMETRVPGGLRVLIVDYLQLVRAPAKDRFQMVSEVSQGLKNIAKQMGIPVIALAQINARSLADREDKRPKLADIRESGQIEQDADVILFTHRDHYHLERSGPPRAKNGQVSVEMMADHEAALSASKHQMDVILAKHRHDGIGEIKLGCDMATNRIWDLHDGDVPGAKGFL